MLSVPYRIRVAGRLDPWQTRGFAGRIITSDIRSAEEELDNKMVG